MWPWKITIPKKDDNYCYNFQNPQATISSNHYGGMGAGVGRVSQQQLGGVVAVKGGVALDRP